MKKYFLYSALVALALVGCDYNEDNFEGFDDFGKPTDVKKGSFEFTDWASLSGNPKTNKYFSEKDKAQDFLPGWLASAYPTADNGSSFTITYDYKDSKTELHDKYYSIKYYKLKDSDYKLVHGEGYYGAYLNKSTVSKLYKILNVEYKDAKEGDVVFTEFNYNETAKPQKMEGPIFTYDFESLTTGDVTSIKNWYVSASGAAWAAKEYDDNKYIQFSANGKGACEAWLITPSVKIEDINKKVGFDVCIGYWNADCLSVLVSSDFDGKDVSKATWKDITSFFEIPQEPTSGYGKFVSAGSYELKEFLGKNVYVAFKYVGDGKNKQSTTYQIDNVVFGNDIPTLVKTEPMYALYEKTDKGWNSVNHQDILTLTPADYTAMGDPGKNFNFSSSIPAEEYLPNYLAKTINYPLDGDEKLMVYKYYNGSEVQVNSDSYLYSSKTARWTKNSYITTQTEQYVKSNGKWNFDPSVVISLPPTKSNATTVLYMQTATDWVWENIDQKLLNVTKKGDGYVTSYGNNEYYTGCSAYYGNVDMRVAKAREQYAAGYEGMDDEAIYNKMCEHLIEVMAEVLAKLNANAVPVDGIEVLYTVQVGIFTGTTVNDCTHQLVYKVTAPGKFEYVEDSFQPIQK